MEGYISRDKFLAEMTELYRKAGWNPNEVHFSLNDLVMNMTGRLEPVRENVTGEWKDTGYIFNKRCSACKKINLPAKFCPDCGAEMLNYQKQEEKDEERSDGAE